jgi:hypothetical protein
MIDGKTLRDATVTAAKLASAFVATLLRADGSVPWTASQNAGGNKLTNLAAPTVDTDAARLADLYSMPWKDKVVAATTANIASLAGGAPSTLDGVTLVANDRVLVKDQTTGSQNGIYIVQTLGTGSNGTWVRAADADSAAELRSAVVYVEGGSVNADKRFAQTADNLTLGTTTIVWVDIGSGTPASFPTLNNKNMTASVTSSDFQVACATAITATPASDSFVRVLVDGVGVTVGNGVKTKDCYFSADSGTTARSIATIAAGDLLYWVGSVAGYQLAATDTIDFDYAV